MFSRQIPEFHYMLPPNAIYILKDPGKEDTIFVRYLRMPCLKIFNEFAFRYHVKERNTKFVFINNNVYIQVR